MPREFYKCEYCGKFLNPENNLSATQWDGFSPIGDIFYHRKCAETDFYFYDYAGKELMHVQRALNSDEAWTLVEESFGPQVNFWECRINKLTNG